MDHDELPSCGHPSERGEGLSPLPPPSDTELGRRDSDTQRSHDWEAEDAGVQIRAARRESKDAEAKDLAGRGGQPAGNDAQYEVSGGSLKGDGLSEVLLEAPDLPVDKPDGFWCSDSQRLALNLCNKSRGRRAESSAKRTQELVATELKRHWAENPPFAVHISIAALAILDFGWTHVGRAPAQAPKVTRQAMPTGPVTLSSD